MTVTLRKGRYLARIAISDADVKAAQALRYLCFVERGGGTIRMDGLDRDNFDAKCQHVLIEDASRQLVACFRLLTLRSGSDIDQSYAAQFYDLRELRGYGGPLAEIGRFCVHPAVQDADVLRVAWGALARFVDEDGITLLFGCASFAGTEPGIYQDAFGLLHQRHIGPKRWLPRIKAPQVIRFAGREIDPKLALYHMPPLLRSYLGMGGWVSDHAVVDPAMNTLHVFTGVEIAAIPAGRARALRAVAG